MAAASNPCTQDQQKQPDLPPLIPPDELLDEIYDRQTFTEMVFISKKTPDRKVYLTPWLKESSLAMIFAERGIGKTFFCLALGMAITRGAQFGAWDTEEPVDCLYVDGEMNISDLKERIAKLAAGFDMPAKANFSVISCESVRVEEKYSVNLSSEAWRKALKRKLERSTYKVVILDNVASLMPGLDENEKAPWDPINQWLLGLRAIGLSVIFVHHSGKDKEKQRGSSGKEDNLDTVIKLTSTATKRSDGARFKVEFTKARAVTGPAADPFTVAVVERDGKLMLTTSVGAIDKFTHIVRMLDKGGNTQKRIGELVGCSGPYVHDVKVEAVEKGWLTQEYKFTDAGRRKFGNLADFGIT